MSTNGFNTQVATATRMTAAISQPPSAPRRHITRLLSSVALRLLIAFIISWVILMAFFVTIASSR
jgi:hypothetical protein